MTREQELRIKVCTKVVCSHIKKCGIHQLFTTEGEIFSGEQAKFNKLVDYIMTGE